MTPYILSLQRTQVQLSAIMMGGLQPSVTPARGNLTSSSGLPGQLYSHAQMYTQFLKTTQEMNKDFYRISFSVLNYIVISTTPSRFYNSKTSKNALLDLKV